VNVDALTGSTTSTLAEDGKMAWRDCQKQPYLSVLAQAFIFGLVVAFRTSIIVFSNLQKAA
jgi:hypothetical protein